MSKLISLIAIIFLFAGINTAEAQFKQNNPKPGKYISWAHKNYGYKGYRLNRDQRNALGLPHGFLGTGIGANKNRNKQNSKSKNKSTTAKKD